MLGQKSLRGALELLISLNFLQLCVRFGQGTMRLCIFFVLLSIVLYASADNPFSRGFKFIKDAAGGKLFHHHWSSSQDPIPEHRLRAVLQSRRSVAPHKGPCWSLLLGEDLDQPPQALSVGISHWKAHLDKCLCVPWVFPSTAQRIWQAWAQAQGHPCSRKRIAGIGTCSWSAFCGPSGCTNPLLLKSQNKAGPFSNAHYRSKLSLPACFETELLQPLKHQSQAKPPCLHEILHKESLFFCFANLPSFSRG